MTGHAGEAGDSSQAQNDKVVAQEHSGARRTVMPNNHNRGGAPRFLFGESPLLNKMNGFVKTADRHFVEMARSVEMKSRVGFFIPTE